MSLGRFGGSDFISDLKAGGGGISAIPGLDSLQQARDQLREAPEGAYTVGRSAVGNFTRDTTLASGTQAVTGLLGTPYTIIFLAIDTGSTLETSIGFTNGTTHECIVRNPSGDFDEATAKSIFLEQVLGTDQYFVDAITMNPDGFTVTWTKVGLPTGTISIMYLAFFRG